MKNAIQSTEINQLKKILEGITSNLRNTFAQCIKAGELLTKIKSNTKYGDWEDVLKSVQLTYKTAQKYMSFWEHRARLNLTEIKTITDAETTLVSCGAIPQPTTQNEPLTTQKTVTSGQRLRSDSANPSNARLDRKTSSETKANDQSTSKAQEPEIRLDKVGRPIPEGILAEWDRAHEIGTKLRSMISEVKCTLQKAIEGDRESDKDPVFRELNNTIISEAEAVHYSLAHILPHAVCPKCQGKTNDRCLMCRQRGFVSKFYWDGPAVGNDLRNLIIRQIKTNDSQAISA